MAKKLSQQIKEEVKEEKEVELGIEELAEILERNVELKNKLLARLKLANGNEKAKKEKIREKVAKYLPAKQITVDIEGQPIVCRPQVFGKSKSVGYNGVGKIMLGGERFQVVINVIKIGFKLTDKEYAEIVNV